MMLIQEADKCKGHCIAGFLLVEELFKMEESSLGWRRLHTWQSTVVILLPILNTFLFPTKPILN